jgi:hypothetical protein
MGQAASDGVDGDAFVRGVGAAGPVEGQHARAACVVQTDQSPFVVGNRAAGAAALGRGAIVQDAVVVVEQDVASFLAAASITNRPDPCAAPDVTGRTSRIAARYSASRIRGRVMGGPVVGSSRQRGAPMNDPAGDIQAARIRIASCRARRRAPGRRGDRRWHGLGSHAADRTGTVRVGRSIPAHRRRPCPGAGAPSPDAVRLEPNHTLFVLVPGTQWGTRRSG